MLNNENIELEASINDLAVEGLQFSMEIYKDVAKRNRDLIVENNHLKTQLNMKTSLKCSVFNLIIYLSAITAIWNIVDQLINK